MYDLNYTFLTELEVDTRQSFDDLSDDLLLLDNNASESQVVDMKSVISSWQNYFWKSTNTNKQFLDITFTDLSIERGTVITTDWQENPLDDLEMMSIEELNNFFDSLDEISAWVGGKTWSQLTNSLTAAITALQAKYVDKNNIYPKNAVLVTNENPNGTGFGTWTSHNNCYFSEIFSKANYSINPGYDHGSLPTNGSLADIGLEPTTETIPNHTHKLAYIPATGSGSGRSEGEAGVAGWEWSNSRRGLDPQQIGMDGTQPRYKYSGKPHSGSAHGSTFTTTVLRDANSSVGSGGHPEAKFEVTSTKVDPIDKKIKVAPKTYPLSATIWERTS